MSTAAEDGNSARVDAFACFNSDLGLSLRKYECNRFTLATNKRGFEIKELTIDSYTTTYVIRKICQDEGKSEEEARKKAVAIIDEIGHTFNLFTIRFMGYLLSKISKSLFRHIYANKSGMEQLKEISKLGPVIYVPSHNSYFDFLLLSYICFIFNLPLPAIASGQDFLHIAVVNRLLRGSGAFYMRRTFAYDECYKLLFKEYVQQVISSGIMPLEFFLEGTRSRNGKASQPKSGLLAMVNETYYMGHSPDIFFCPISISFECVPEENLYTYEVLGLPKPKESLSGLLKAKSILSHDYGSVNFHFGKPMSLEEISKSKIDRSLYSSLARTSSKVRDHLNKQEKAVNDELGRWLVHEQQSNMTLYTRSVVAAIMIQNTKPLQFDDLVFQASVVVDFLQASGCNLNDDGDLDKAGVKYAIDLLNPNVRITGTSTVQKVPVPDITEQLRTSDLGQCLKDTKLLGSTLTYIFLSQQRNKLLLWCSVAAFICKSLVAKGSTMFTSESIFDDVSFLYNLMQVELVYHPAAQVDEEIEKSLDRLQKSACIVQQRDENGRSFQVLDTAKAQCLQNFLADLFTPFLETYWFVCQVLLAEPLRNEMSVSKLSRKFQLQAAKAVEQGVLQMQEALSLHTLENAIKFLVKSGALVASRDASLQLLVSEVKMDELHKILNRICDISNLPRERLMSTVDGIGISGKL